MVAIAPSRINFVLMDIVWRAIWLVVILAVTVAAVFWFGARIGSLQWQGPDLGPANPMIMLVAMQEIWNLFSGALFWSIGGIFVLAVLLWLILEAYFRGGAQQFWLFLASAASRVTIIGTAIFLLVVLASMDGSGSALVGGGVALLALGFAIVVAETLIRCDAVELWGTHLSRIATVIGVTFFIEVVSFILLTAVSAALLLRSSQITELLVALIFSAAALGLWSILHSYLLIRRLSAIDIMRRDVRGV